MDLKLRKPEEVVALLCEGSITGKPGASLNIGKKGTRTSVGIPGTGLSYSKYQPYENGANKEQIPIHEQQPIYLQTTEKSKSNIWFWVVFGIFCFIISAMFF